MMMDGLSCEKGLGTMADGSCFPSCVVSGIANGGSDNDAFTRLEGKKGGKRKARDESKFLNVSR